MMQLKFHLPTQSQAIMKVLWEYPLLSWINTILNNSILYLSVKVKMGKI